MASPPTKNLSPKVPPRPPASTVLWAHLLTSTGSAASTKPASGGIAPPLTPLDKTGTSMRVLLHDTQARFEQFSARIDALLVGVRDAHAGVVRVQGMFERGHEDLSGDITDLINRSQSSIQKSVGNPAQGEELENLRKDVGHQLEALDKRLDAMHLGHAQTLQIQSKALQTLQEQQGTILAALMPILPLVQALPLYIDKAKASIIEACTGSYGSANNPSIPRNGTATASGSRKRSNSMLSDESPSSPLNAKRRRRPDALHTGSDGHRGFGVSGIQLPRRQSSCHTRMTGAPRKPLVELLQSSLYNLPLENKDLREAPILKDTLEMGGRELINMRTSAGEQSEGQLGDKPREERVQSDVAKGRVVPSLSHTPVPSMAPCPTTHLKAPAVSTERVLKSSVTPTSARTDRLHMNQPTARTMAPAPMPMPRSMSIVPQVKGVSGAGVTRMSLGGMGGVYGMPSRVRERRSPFREGRRFIPFDDSDGDDSEE